MIPHRFSIENPKPADFRKGRSKSSPRSRLGSSLGLRWMSALATADLRSYETVPCIALAVISEHSICANLEITLE